MVLRRVVNTQYCLWNIPVVVCEGRCFKGLKFVLKLCGSLGNNQLGSLKVSRNCVGMKRWWKQTHPREGVEPGHGRTRQLHAEETDQKLSPLRPISFIGLESTSQKWMSNLWNQKKKIMVWRKGLSFIKNIYIILWQRIILGMYIISFVFYVCEALYSYENHRKAREKNNEIEAGG